MRIIGCDLHARQQTLAMLDTVTGDEVLGMIWRFGTGHPDARFRRSRPKAQTSGRRSCSRSVKNSGSH